MYDLRVWGVTTGVDIPNWEGACAVEGPYPDECAFGISYGFFTHHFFTHHTDSPAHQITLQLFVLLLVRFSRTVCLPLASWIYLRRRPFVAYLFELGTVVAQKGTRRRSEQRVFSSGLYLFVHGRTWMCDRTFLSTRFRSLTTGVPRMAWPLQTVGVKAGTPRHIGERPHVRKTHNGCHRCTDTSACGRGDCSGPTAKTARACCRWFRAATQCGRADDSRLQEFGLPELLNLPAGAYFSGDKGSAWQMDFEATVHPQPRSALAFEGCVVFFKGNRLGAAQTRCVRLSAVLGFEPQMRQSVRPQVRARWTFNGKMPATMSAGLCFTLH